MSFSIKLKKNEQGTYDITTTGPETLPTELRIDGHVEEALDGSRDQQVVDLSVRADGLYASSSRRDV